MAASLLPLLGLQNGADHLLVQVGKHVLKGFKVFFSAGDDLWRTAGMAGIAMGTTPWLYIPGTPKRTKAYIVFCFHL